MGSITEHRMSVTDDYIYKTDTEYLEKMSAKLSAYTEEVAFKLTVNKIAKMNNKQKPYKSKDIARSMNNMYSAKQKISEYYELKKLNGKQVDYKEFIISYNIETALIYATVKNKNIKNNKILKKLGFRYSENDKVWKLSLNLENVKKLEKLKKS